MAKYTGIADISEKIMALLQAQLVPELIPDAGKISLCSPEEHKDSLLGIFLYDVRESEEIRRSGMRNLHSSRQAYPPIYLNLYYMITAYAASDLKYRMVQEQQILGRVLQYFHDYPLLASEQTEQEDIAAVNIQVEWIPLDLEQKMKLWSFGSQPYRLSLFYKVSPIVIESARFREISRVREVDIHVASMSQDRRN